MRKKELITDDTIMYVTNLTEFNWVFSWPANRRNGIFVDYQIGLLIIL